MSAQEFGSQLLKAEPLSQSSVKISTTAAGKPLVEVKVYADGGLVGSAEEAAAKAVAIYKNTVQEVGA
jgi:hypothetical protein